MRRFATLAFISLAVAPSYSLAGVEAVACPGAHFVRDGGREMRSTVIAFRNADLENAATIERITIRNVFGHIVHDSGPATGRPHPLNNSFPGGLDITLVPAGGNYFLATGDIWGLNSIPDADGSQGFVLSIVVQFSKEGKPDLLKVGTRLRSRERFDAPLREGAERSSNTGTCADVKPTL